MSRIAVDCHCSVVHLVHLVCFESDSTVVHYLFLFLVLQLCSLPVLRPHLQHPLPDPSQPLPVLHLVMDPV